MTAPDLDDLLEQVRAAAREVGRLEGYAEGRQSMVDFLAREVIAGRLVVVPDVDATVPAAFPRAVDVRSIDAQVLERFRAAKAAR